MKTIDTEVLTPKNLEVVFGEDVSGAYDYVRDLLPEYPERPRKPRLNPNPSAEIVRKYADELEIFEKANLKFREAQTHYNAESSKAFGVLEEYMKNISGFYDHVPSNRQSKVWNKAWSDGHASGYTEVYYNLKELVELFIDEK